LLKSESTNILVVLKNVSQTISGFHSSGVWFQDGSQQVSGDCGVYPLKDGGVKGGPPLILDTGGICRCCLVLRRDNMMQNPMRKGMNAEKFGPSTILVFLHLKNNGNMVLDVGNNKGRMKLGFGGCREGGG